MVTARACAPVLPDWPATTGSRQRSAKRAAGKRPLGGGHCPHRQQAQQAREQDPDHE
jgi:hypothetical protein